MVNEFNLGEIEPTNESTRSFSSSGSLEEKKNRFKLWRVLDFLERHTEEWGVIDTSIECENLEEAFEYEGILVSYENLLDEEEVVDLLNNFQNIQEGQTKFVKDLQNCMEKVLENNRRLRVQNNELKGEVNKLCSFFVSKGFELDEFNEFIVEGWKNE